MNQRKIILFSAPSGCGKTTIINHLCQHFDCFEFAISATSRAPRGNEQNGVEYYFISHEEFKAKVARDEFVEWEEVYEGTCYGTLKSEIKRIQNNGHVIVFDVDVHGGRNLKRIFGNDALSIFIMPPSIEELEHRLRSRGTDSEESITRRIQRSSTELQESKYFDVTIVNDDLEKAVEETRRTIENWL